MDNNFEHRIPLVEKGVEPVKKFLVENGPGVEYQSGPYEGTCMLRLDWELAYGSQEELDSLLHGNRERVIGLMFQPFVVDLADLLVNGDTRNTSDVFLKSFDGERIRGKEAVGVLVPAAQYFQEVKARKNIVEYTLYFRFGAKFE